MKTSTGRGRRRGRGGAQVAAPKLVRATTYKTLCRDLPFRRTLLRASLARSKSNLDSKIKT